MKEEKYNKPLVSIIIPNWNGKDFLKTCLDSIYNQTYRNFEVIIIDCASSDGSVGFVKENYPKVRLIELKEDKGSTNALNVGIKESKGTYILLLSNDIILPPNCLTVLVSELQQDENSVISPVELDWERNFRRTGGSFSFFNGFLHRLFGPFSNIPLSPFWPLVACCICTKQTLLDTPLNEHFWMYEELEWGWRLHLKQIKIKISFDTFYLHKVEGTVKKLTPKQAFLYSRLMIATCFICLKLPTLFLLSPFIALYYLKLGGAYIKRGKLKSFIAYLRGFLNFLLNIKIFMQDRKIVQKERKIGDWDILKIMENSLVFQKVSKEKWIKSQNNTKYA